MWTWTGSVFELLVFQMEGREQAVVILLVSWNCKELRPQKFLC